ncbi:MAG: hypothetical protein ACLQUY_04175 [Ktedonobacterales bacterium]
MSRESPALEVGNHLTGEHVGAVLERLAQVGTVLRMLQVDNGPGFSSEP